MFLELTEVVLDRLMTYASAPKERKISINSSKIQSFWSDTSGNTVLEMRKSQIKVREDYETVKTMLNSSI